MIRDLEGMRYDLKEPICGLEKFSEVSIHA